MYRTMVLLLVVCIAAGCTTQSALSGRVVDNSADYPAIWLDPSNCGVHSTDSNARRMLASLAALSNNVYIPLAKEGDCRDRAAAGCERHTAPLGDWKIAGGNGEDSPTGLVYRIYEGPGSVPGTQAVVFAFRGTEPSLLDWGNNFYPRTAIAPPQHREADAAIRAWISANRAGWNLQTGAGMEAEEVYAVGHSLGGGIAQYLAYTLPRITAVVFNPSPRTAYRSIAPEVYRNPPVCRMRESYEAVYTLVGGQFPSVSPNLHACGFINQKRLGWRLLSSLISAHGMQTMAESLACYAADGVPQGECVEVIASRHKAMPGVACR